jgi:threonine dehydratase
VIDIAAAVGGSGHIIETPLIEWRAEGLWLKCENAQLTGSFKLRGALNKIASAGRGGSGRV